MKTTKELIVEQAKVLFNEKGYYKVTMRDIAKQAQTTLGNLTYHFPRKEDLVLEIQKDAHGNLLQVLEKHLKQGEAHAYSLAEVFETFVNTERTEREYSYYFNNLMELGQDFPNIHKHQQASRSIFLRYYYAAFVYLQHHGVLRAEISNEHCHALARTIVLLMTIWNQHSSPTHDAALADYSYLTTCSDLIHPFLTKEGQQDYSDYFSCR